MEDEPEKNIVLIYGDVCLRTKRQRRKRQKLLVIELLFDYARNSTLHGLRYTVERGLNIVENLFWFITVIASIGLCSYCIYDMYIKWSNRPIIVTVNERLVSVGSIPFPAVTICPQIKVKRNVYDYTAVQKKYDENYTSSEKLYGAELLEFQLIDTMCTFSRYGYGNEEDSSLTDVSYIHLITKVAPDINDIFYTCKIADITEDEGSDCSKWFSRVYTKDGVCYTSNILSEKEIFENSTQKEYRYLESDNFSVGWSPDTGYDNSVTDPYPRRGRVLDLDPDMQIELKHNPDLGDKNCNTLFSGYKIYLHHPADFPQSSLYSYAALPNQESSLAINFDQLSTDSNLFQYATKVRQCYFPKEKELRYFKIYTAKNCLAECLSYYTFNLCQCVGFYMPHSNSSEICSPKQKECMINATKLMATNEINPEVELVTESFRKCNCLPACDSIEYEADIFNTEFNLKDIKMEKNYSYSRLNLFFKKPKFVTMQRRELFGVTDFLANIGGLLGLFLGFSCLSLIEIFYFLTLRVGFTLWRDLQEEKSIKKDQRHN